MIEGGWRAQKGKHELATACAKASEPILDHLDSGKQASILAAIETVVSELLGFSSEINRAWAGQNYRMPARSREQLLSDPSVIAQIKKEHAEAGGDVKDLPW